MMKIHIEQGDLTDYRVDAIVNAANKHTVVRGPWAVGRNDEETQRRPWAVGCRQ
jgi:hypothetical protein